MNAKRTSLLLSLSVVLGFAACQNGPQESTILPGISAIVFASRIATDANGNAVIDDTQVLDYRRYVPGGGLFVLAPPTPTGTLTNLVADQTTADIQGLDVSFDGRQVVFSMRTSDADAYHIYIANVDGSPMDTGANGRAYRQLTFSANDDVYPVWAPGTPEDRIYFVSNQPAIYGIDSMGTRADEYNHGRAVSQLASVTVSGGDADRIACSENLSHSVFPFLRADGRIGYSRWEHLGGTNDVKLFAMNPDCTSMVAIAGQHGKPSNSLVEVREFPDQPNRMIAIATDRERTIHSGSLVTVTSQRPGGGPADLNEEGASYERLTPSVPLGRGDSPDGRYRTPYPLNGTQILTSWAPGFVSDRNEMINTAPNFGVYLFDSTTGTRTLVYDNTATWELYAMPVNRTRFKPPAFPIGTGTGTGGVRLGAVDLAQTSLAETISPNAWYTGTPFLTGVSLRDAIMNDGVAVRIIEGFSSEVGSVSMFGITEFEGAAILGEVPIYADGSYQALAPPRIPMHQQIIDQFGLSIRSEGLWVQGLSGEARTCGGCHENRIGTVLPRSGPTTIAQQQSVASAPDGVTNVNWSLSQRATPLPGQNHGELPWDTTIQPIFDRNCVQCHSSSAPACTGGSTNCDPFAGQTYTIRYTDPMTGAFTDYVIPVLDLSSTPVTAVYDRMVATWPASYVTLKLPGSMMRNTEVIAGVMPAPYIEESDARGSRLIQKLNLRAPDGSLVLAGAPVHPDDVGVTTMTAEERLNLVRVIDLGAQYYSRLNVPNSILGMGCAYPPCP